MHLLRNLGIAFGENVLSKCLNFMIILVLTRWLGPEDYGKYSLIFVTVALSSALFDFGMENTAVRFSAKHREKKQGIFGLYLMIKLITMAILILFFLLAGPWLFGLMDKQDVLAYMPYLIVGLIGESLFFVNDTWLQANQQFRLRAILNVSRMAVALLYIVGLLTFNRLALDTAMGIYVVPLIFSLLFLGKYVRFVRSYIKNRLNPVLLGEMLDYERWMFIFSIGNNLLGRIDFLMLGFWVGFYQLGIYNAAFQMCAVVSFLPLVLGKVLLPVLAELKEVEIRQMTNQIVRITTFATLGVMTLIPLSGVAVPLLLGKEYAEAVPVLQLLLLAFSGGLITMPFEQALYSLGKPKLLCTGKYIQLGMVIMLNLIFIPLLGIYAVAVNTLVVRMLYLAFIIHCYRRMERNLSYVPAEVR